MEQARIGRKQTSDGGEGVRVGRPYRMLKHRIQLQVKLWPCCRDRHARCSERDTMLPENLICDQDGASNHWGNDELSSKCCLGTG